MKAQAAGDAANAKLAGKDVMAPVSSSSLFTSASNHSHGHTPSFPSSTNHLTFCLVLDNIIALLNDPEPAVWAPAINMLLEVVDYFWYEIAEANERLTAIAKEASGPVAGAAWLLLAKLHFHLGDYDRSVACALAAGPLFALDDRSAFVTTIIARAIDIYIEQQREQDPKNDDELMMNDAGTGQKASLVDAVALKSLVERLIEHCLAIKEVKQVIGIAIDTQRLDILEAALKSSDSPATAMENLNYARLAILKHVGHVSQRMALLALIAKLAASLEPHPDYVFVADCLVAMGDASGCANLLNGLLSQKGGNDGHLRPVILQICFNVAADASQAFQQAVLAAVKEQLGNINDLEDAFKKNVVATLDGSSATALQLEFLYRANAADMQIMERVKEYLNEHSSMHHTVLTCANAIMHAGTTNDEFLRKNMDWLGYASNWAKFTAASSLGVIHRGQGARGREILKPYLPTGDGSGSPYAEGGAMFALGLMNAGSEGAAISERAYFLEQLGRTDNEVLLHGICLGMGSLAMSSGDMELVEAAKSVLYQDNAVSGEAAAIAIGLILHGTGAHETANELLQYAQETQHEKTIRGLAMAIALIYAGQRDRADALIARLTGGEQRDPLLRYGGMWLVATAYAGCSDRGALGRLLHAAVSDASDDVRRAAVSALGLVLCQTPGELPRLVELLTESYNPHVRYGAALALGLAFAGTGNEEAINLLKPMTSDFTDFVRQGAYLALALIIQQMNEVTCSEAPWVRTTVEGLVTTKMVDPMVKFGAVLATGLMDAGGRNSVLRLVSPSGHLDHRALAGAALFAQLWYWYPMTHFLSLALAPTGLIAIDEQLRVPANWAASCASAPSRFALPPPIRKETAAAPKKLISAILSTTAKAAAAKAKKGRGRPNESAPMEVDSGGQEVTGESSAPAKVKTTAVAAAAATSSTPEGDKANPSSPPTAMEVEKSGQGEEGTANKEPDFFIVKNLSRVTPLQMSLMSFLPSDRYEPVTSAWRGEIMVLVDRHPNQAGEEYIPLSESFNKDQDKDKVKEKQSSPTAAIKTDVDEPAPPKPFVYTEK